MSRERDDYMEQCARVIDCARQFAKERRVGRLSGATNTALIDAVADLDLFEHRLLRHFGKPFVASLLPRAGAAAADDGVVQAEDP